MNWVEYRRTHSITDDAFVEAHIVNVAPQLVSGRIIRFLADENDRVGQGQVVAEIDPIPYRDKVNVSRAQLDCGPGRAGPPACRPGRGSARRCRSRSRSPGGHVRRRSG